MSASAFLFTYTLHLADNVLILGQRNSEWCGHGPVLEQDIAITNISLDLIGQARSLYQYAALQYNQMLAAEKESVDALIPQPWKAYGRDLNEDDLAFLRDAMQYRHVLLNELPIGDWAVTVLRQCFFSAYQFYFYTALQKSSDPQLAAIAVKSLKEVTYHLRWSSEWVVRLGDGTEESHDRLQKAFAELWPYAGELCIPADYEQAAQAAGIGVDMTMVKKAWEEKIVSVLQEATLLAPEAGLPNVFDQRGGKEGSHTEHLGYILAELQYLQRAYPNSEW